MYYRRAKQAMSIWGHAMMVEDRVDDTGAYEGDLYCYDGHEGVRIETLYDAIVEAWNEGNVPEDYEGIAAEEIVSSFNPQDIINSAEAYDDAALLTWFWENVLEQEGIYAVLTQDGAVVFDEDLLEECPEDEE